jgi:hypothetical protein
VQSTLSRKRLTVLDTCFNRHFILEVSAGRESTFQADLELGRVSPPQIRAVWWDDRHCVSISVGKRFELSAEHKVVLTAETRFFVIAMSRHVSISVGKCFELSAEHKVVYTAETRSFVIAISRHQFGREVIRHSGRCVGP